MPRHVLTDEERRKAGSRSRAKQPELHDANLRHWHVLMGHRVADPTPEEQALIDEAHRRLRAGENSLTPEQLAEFLNEP